MKVLTLLRRAAGKPPGYVFRKAVTEIRRLLNAGRFRRRLAALTAGELARKAGFDSVQVLWNSRLELGTWAQPVQPPRSRSVAEG